MHTHRVNDYMNSVYIIEGLCLFKNKLNMVSMPTHLPL